MTIVWHVVDLKISHCDGCEITEIIKWLGKIYGDIKVKQGKKHRYLGMDLDFEQKGIVKASMIPYVEEIINNFPKPVGASIASNPAGDHLFQTRDLKEAKLIDEDQAIRFHHNVEKLLFVSNQARQDIQTAVAFLTT